MDKKLLRLNLKRFRHNHAPTILSKSLSLLIMLSFLWPSLTWAFEATTYPTSGAELRFNQQTIRIPKAYAQTLEAFQGQKQLLIHIQDLHCNFEVQQNIANLLAYLSKTYGIQCVAVEGASQPINVMHLATCPSEQVKQSVGKYFMQQGKLTGAEYYAAIGKSPVALQGIEDPGLYQASRKAVNEFLNEESQGWIYDLREKLEEVKPRVNPGELEEYAQLSQTLNLLEKLLNISATPQELETYRLHPEQFSAKLFLDFIRKHADADGMELDPDVLQLDACLLKAREFYQLADQRSTCFVSNTLRLMSSRKAAAAVMITGGFHTPAILQQLQARGISYLSLQPTLSHADVVNPYFALLKNQRTSLEKLLLQNQNILSLEPNSPEDPVTNQVLSQAQLAAKPTRVRLFVECLQLLVESGLLGEETRAIQKVLEAKPAFEQSVQKYAGQNSNLGPVWDETLGNDRTHTYCVPFMADGQRLLTLVTRPVGSNSKLEPCLARLTVGDQEIILLENQQFALYAAELLAESRTVRGFLAQSAWLTSPIAIAIANGGALAAFGQASVKLPIALAKQLETAPQTFQKTVAAPLQSLASTFIGEYGLKALENILRDSAGEILSQLEPGQTILEWAGADSNNLSWATTRLLPRVLKRQKLWCKPLEKYMSKNRAGLLRNQLQTYIKMCGLNPELANTRVAVINRKSKQSLPAGMKADLLKLGIFNYGGTIYITQELADSIPGNLEQVAALLLHEVLRMQEIEPEQVEKLVKKTTGFSHAELANRHDLNYAMVDFYNQLKRTRDRVAEDKPGQCKRIAHLTDLHGDTAALDEVLVRVLNGEIDQVIIHGDLFDRGTLNREVFKRVKLLKETLGDNCILLFGNHERDMIQAVESMNPELITLWLANGGDKTLAEFRVPVHIELGKELKATLYAKHQALAANDDWKVNELEGLIFQQIDPVMNYFRNYGVPLELSDMVNWLRLNAQFSYDDEYLNGNAHTVNNLTSEGLILFPEHKIETLNNKIVHLQQAIRAKAQLSQSTLLDQMHLRAELKKVFEELKLWLQTRESNSVAQLDSPEKIRMWQKTVKRVSMISGHNEVYSIRTIGSRLWNLDVTGGAYIVVSPQGIHAYELSAKDRSQTKKELELLSRDQMLEMYDELMADIAQDLQKKGLKLESPILPTTQSIPDFNQYDIPEPFAFDYLRHIPQVLEIIRQNTGVTLDSQELEQGMESAEAEIGIFSIEDLFRPIHLSKLRELIAREYQTGGYQSRELTLDIVQSSKVANLANQYYESSVRSKNHKRLSLKDILGMIRTKNQLPKPVKAYLLQVLQLQFYPNIVSVYRLGMPDPNEPASEWFVGDRNGQKLLAQATPDKPLLRSDFGRLRMAGAIFPVMDTATSFMSEDQVILAHKPTPSGLVLPVGCERVIKLEGKSNLLKMVTLKLLGRWISPATYDKYLVGFETLWSLALAGVGLLFLIWAAPEHTWSWLSVGTQNEIITTFIKVTLLAFPILHLDQVAKTVLSIFSSSQRLRNYQATPWGNVAAAAFISFVTGLLWLALPVCGPALSFLLPILVFVIVHLTFNFRNFLWNLLMRLLSDMQERLAGHQTPSQTVSFLGEYGLEYLERIYANSTATLQITLQTGQTILAWAAESRGNFKRAFNTTLRAQNIIDFPYGNYVERLAKGMNKKTSDYPAESVIRQKVGEWLQQAGMDRRLAKKMPIQVLYRSSKDPAPEGNDLLKMGVFIQNNTFYVSSEIMSRAFNLDIEILQILFFHELLRWQKKSAAEAEELVETITGKSHQAIAEWAGLLYQWVDYYNQLVRAREKIADGTAEFIVHLADLHGNPRLLEDVLQLARRYPNLRIIFHGDIFDRGDKNHDTLKKLKELKDLLGDRCEIMLGNHERDMIEAVVFGYGSCWRVWYHNGGDMTLEEYGIDISTELDEFDAHKDDADKTKEIAERLMNRLNEPANQAAFQQLQQDVLWILNNCRVYRRDSYVRGNYHAGNYIYENGNVHYVRGNLLIADDNLRKIQNAATQASSWQEALEIYKLNHLNDLFDYLWRFVGSRQADFVDRLDTEEKLTAYSMGMEEAGSVGGHNRLPGLGNTGNRIFSIDTDAGALMLCTPKGLAYYEYGKGNGVKRVYHLYDKQQWLRHYDKLIQGAADEIAKLGLQPPQSSNTFNVPGIATQPSEPLDFLRRPEITDTLCVRLGCSDADVTNLVNEIERQIARKPEIKEMFLREQRRKLQRYDFFFPSFETAMAIYSETAQRLDLLFANAKVGTEFRPFLDGIQRLLTRMLPTTFPEKNVETLLGAIMLEYYRPEAPVFSAVVADKAGQPDNQLTPTSEWYIGDEGYQKAHQECTPGNGKVVIRSDFGRLRMAGTVLPTDPSKTVQDKVVLVHRLQSTLEPALIEYETVGRFLGKSAALRALTLKIFKIFSIPSHIYDDHLVLFETTWTILAALAGLGIFWLAAPSSSWLPTGNLEEIINTFMKLVLLIFPIVHLDQTLKAALLGLRLNSQRLREYQPTPVSNLAAAGFISLVSAALWLALPQGWPILLQIAVVLGTWVSIHQVVNQPYAHGGRTWINIGFKAVIESWFIMYGVPVLGHWIRQKTGIDIQPLHDPLRVLLFPILHLFGPLTYWKKSNGQMFIVTGPNENVLGFRMLYRRWWRGIALLGIVGMAMHIGVPQLYFFLQTCLNDVQWITALASHLSRLQPVVNSQAAAIWSHPFYSLVFTYLAARLVPKLSSWLPVAAMNFDEPQKTPPPELALALNFGMHQAKVSVRASGLKEEMGHRYRDIEMLSTSGFYDTFRVVDESGATKIIHYSLLVLDDRYELREITKDRDNHSPIFTAYDNQTQTNVRIRLGSVTNGGAQIFQDSMTAQNPANFGCFEFVNIITGRSSYYMYEIMPESARKEIPVAPILSPLADRSTLFGTIPSATENPANRAGQQSTAALSLDPADASSLAVVPALSTTGAAAILGAPISAVGTLKAHSIVPIADSDSNKEIAPQPEDSALKVPATAAVEAKSNPASTRVRNVAAIAPAAILRSPGRLAVNTSGISLASFSDESRRATELPQLYQQITTTRDRQLFGNILPLWYSSLGKFGDRSEALAILANCLAAAYGNQNSEVAEYYRSNLGNEVFYQRLGVELREGELLACLFLAQAANGLLSAEARQNTSEQTLRLAEQISRQPLANSVFKEIQFPGTAALAILKISILPRWLVQQLLRLANRTAIVLVKSTALQRVLPHASISEPTVEQRKRMALNRTFNPASDLEPFSTKYTPWFSGESNRTADLPQLYEQLKTSKGPEVLAEALQSWYFYISFAKLGQAERTRALALLANIMAAAYENPVYIEYMRTGEQAEPTEHHKGNSTRTTPLVLEYYQRYIFQPNRSTTPLKGIRSGQLSRDEISACLYLAQKIHGVCPYSELDTTTAHMFSIANKIAEEPLANADIRKLKQELNELNRFKLLAKMHPVIASELTEQLYDIIRTSQTPAVIWGEILNDYAEAVRENVFKDKTQALEVLQNLYQSVINNRSFAWNVKGSSNQHVVLKNGLLARIDGIFNEKIILPAERGNLGNLSVSEVAGVWEAAVQQHEQVVAHGHTVADSSEITASQTHASAPGEAIQPSESVAPIQSVSEHEKHSDTEPNVNSASQSLLPSALWDRLTRVGTSESSKQESTFQDLYDQALAVHAPNAITAVRDAYLAHFLAENLDTQNKVKQAETVLTNIAYQILINNQIHKISKNTAELIGSIVGEIGIKFDEKQITDSDNGIDCLVGSSEISKIGEALLEVSEYKPGQPVSPETSRFLLGLDKNELTPELATLVSSLNKENAEGGISELLRGWTFGVLRFIRVIGPNSNMNQWNAWYDRWAFIIETIWVLSLGAIFLAGLWWANLAEFNLHNVILLALPMLPALHMDKNTPDANKRWALFISTLTFLFACVLPHTMLANLVVIAVFVTLHGITNFILARQAISGLSAEDYLASVMSPATISLAAAGFRNAVGTFMPLFQSRSERDWGITSFKDMEKAADAHQAMGQNIMQFSPINSMSLNSPYLQESSRALDPVLTDIEALLDEFNIPEGKRFVEEHRTEIAVLRAKDQVDYEYTRDLKMQALRIIWEVVKNQPESPIQVLFAAFQHENQDWLEDHMLYLVMKKKCLEDEKQRGVAWDKLRDWDWRRWGKEGETPALEYPGLWKRDAAAVAAAKKGFNEEILFRSFVQFVADRQYNQLKEHCARVGVAIMEDIPLAPAEADVWIDPAICGLKAEDGFQRMTIQGVPAEVAYPSGQYWQFYPYAWGTPAAMKYLYGVFRYHQKHASYIRLDHVLGFDRTYHFTQDTPAKMTLGKLGLYEDLQRIKRQAMEAGTETAKQEACNQALELLVKKLRTFRGRVPKELRDVLPDDALELLLDAKGNLRPESMLAMARQVPDTSQKVQDKWGRETVVEKKVFCGQPEWDFIRLTPDQNINDGGFMYNYLFTSGDLQPDDSLRLSYFKPVPRAESILSEYIRMAQEQGTTLIWETLGVVPEAIQRSVQRLGAFNYCPVIWGEKLRWSATMPNPYHPDNIPQEAYATYGLHDSVGIKHRWQVELQSEHQASENQQAGTGIKTILLNHWFGEGNWTQGDLLHLTDKVHEKMLELVYKSNAGIMTLTWNDILALSEDYRPNIPGKQTGQWMNRLPKDCTLEHIYYAAKGEYAKSTSRAIRAVKMIKKLTEIGNRLKPDLDPKEEKLLAVFPRADGTVVQMRDLGKEPFLVDCYAQGNIHQATLIITNKSGRVIQTIPMRKVAPVAEAQTHGLSEAVVMWRGAWKALAAGEYGFSVEITKSDGSKEIMDNGRLMAVHPNTETNPIAPGYGAGLTPKKPSSASASAKEPNQTLQALTEVQDLLPEGIAPNTQAPATRLSLRAWYHQAHTKFSLQWARMILRFFGLNIAGFKAGTWGHAVFTVGLCEFLARSLDVLAIPYAIWAMQPDASRKFKRYERRQQSVEQCA